MQKEFKGVLAEDSANAKLRIAFMRSRDPDDYEAAKKEFYRLIDAGYDPHFLGLLEKLRKYWNINLEWRW